MEQLVQKIKEIFSLQIIIAIIVIIVCVVLLWIIIRSNKIKKLKLRLAELENEYTNLLSIPIEFNVNKAISLARVNQEFRQIVDNCQKDYEIIRLKMHNASELISEIDENIYSGKIKNSRLLSDDLAENLEDIKQQCNAINQVLAQVLAEETKLRTKITNLKEEFRNLNLKLKADLATYPLVEDYLSNSVINIEANFNKFEQLMFNSEYDEAKNILQYCEDDIKYLRTYLDKLPKLHQRFASDIPILYQEIKESMTKIKNDNISLEHLDLDQRIQKISHDVRSGMVKLSNGEYQSVEQVFEQSIEDLIDIKKDIDLEIAALDQLKDNFSNLSDLYFKLEAKINLLSDIYQKNSYRYSLADYQENLNHFNQRIAEIKQEFELASDNLHSKKFIASKLNSNFISLIKDVQNLETNVKVIEDSIFDTDKLETDAVNNISMMEATLNNLIAKIKAHKLDYIYNAHVSRINIIQHSKERIIEFLKQQQIDSNILKLMLTEAKNQFFISYNEINRAYKTALLAEEIIVYSNLYRGYSNDFDSQLNRAELYYRNNDFDNSLKISLKILEDFNKNLYNDFIQKKEKIN